MQQAPDDITQLYREFGGRPQGYRELNRAREAERARERWPLISRLEDMPSAAAVPPVQAGENSHEAPRRWGVVAVPVATATHQQQPLPSTPAVASQAPAAARAAAMPLPWLRQPEASIPARAPVKANIGSQIEPTLEQAAAPAVAPMFAALHHPAASRPTLWAPDLQTPGRNGGPGSMPASPRVEPPASARPAVVQAPAWLAPAPATAGDELPRAFASLGRPASAPVPAAAVAAAAVPAPAPFASAWNRPAATTSMAQPAASAGTESPLSRLARPAPAPVARQGGLHNLFARFLGRENS